MKKDIDKAIFINIMDDFKKEKRVFSNEAQFQFELAQKLMNKGYSVLFEVLSIDENKKKIYTDLVIDLGDNEYVAIELKYKTAGRPSTTKDIKGYDKEKNMFVYKDKKGNDQYISPQGAEDDGSYYFLRDVERIEKMKKGEIVFNFDKNIVKGYAIIIANSKEGSKTAYWYDRSEDLKKPVWYYFNLAEERTISNEKLDGYKIGKREYGDVNLSGEYQCKWESFYDDDTYSMKYLIFEI